MMSRALIGLLFGVGAALGGCVHTNLLNTGGLTLRLGKDQELGSTEAVAMAGGFDQMQASFTTSTFAIVSAEGGMHSYTAYVAGDLQQPDSTAHGSLSASDPILHLHSGWAYVYGNHPVVQTQRIRAIGERGTRFIIEITPTLDRIYLVPATGEHKVAIECLGNDPPALLELTAQRTYIEIGDDCSVAGPHDVIGSPQHEFVHSVRQAAIDQNLEWYRETQWP